VNDFRADIPAKAGIQRLVRRWAPAFAGVAIVFLVLGAPAHTEDLVLRAAVQDHPHVRAILDGRVKEQGCALRDPAGQEQ
jgi:hypothetical protein